MTTSVRDAIPADVDRIKTIAVDADMFSLDEVGFFDEMLDGFFDGSMEGHRWLVLESSDVAVAAAYYAPEPFSDRLWNLYFLAVDPARQGSGAGGILISHIEQQLTEAGSDVARVLLVETSSTEQYELTREFYRKQNFVEEARIREFYGPGDDKIVFWKSLTEAD